nr:MAG TPA: Global DNA-binding transcriptional dual regulator binding protein, Hha [Caudoviricetes sp.]
MTTELSILRNIRKMKIALRHMLMWNSCMVHVMTL